MHYTLAGKKMLPKSQVQLTLQIDAAFIVSEQEHVLDEAARDAELPGFRKGKVPKDVLRKRMGEMGLWEDAAMHALSHVLAEIFKKDELDVIGRPEVSALKLAPDNPAEFKVTVALFPKLTLPDYKALAAKQNKKPVEETKTEEKEIDAVITQIGKEHEQRTNTKDFKVSEENVKELGEFSSVADLRAKVEEGLTAHKKSKAADKRRAELLDKVTENTKGELPDVLIDNELQRLEGEFRTQLERMGATLETYLREIKKDIEAVRKEWRPDAEKRARLHLALALIAKAEKIEAPKEEVEVEVKHVLEHYKDAREENVRVFVENTILNQKTISFLEDQK